ncbi:hypothetical protein ACM9HF_15365 [Colwellia sp. RE-S-Sl-9]
MQLFLFKKHLFLFCFFSFLLTTTIEAKERTIPLIKTTVVVPVNDTVPVNTPINVPVNVVEVSPHSILLTQNRIDEVARKIRQDNTVWNLLTTTISNYYEKVPYNAGEYAAAFALAYYVSGDQKYINRAAELLQHAYFSEPDIGWEYYQSRNLFRSGARWAVMGYSWIKDHISLEEQKKIENILKLWSEYWLSYADIDNNFESLRLEDTDDVTSLTHNLTLLGTVLSDTSEHYLLGQKTLSAADNMLERFVVNYYMKNIMKGGAWAEGSDYSPNTQRHWIETFLINKEQRGIPYPINYAREATHSLIHQTLASGSGVYKYGSEEQAIDYDSLSDDYRYEFALALMAILEDTNDLALINNWFNKLINKEGFKIGSMVTSFNRLLFHSPELTSYEAAPQISTLNYAEGIGLISSRSDWTNEATNLFFINRKIRVDHEHKDALSFDIAYKGQWITKETTGYAGVSESSRAHNTILIENVDDGSSNPTRRPKGDPKYHTLYDDDNVTLISAEATDVYNMIGYWGTDYTSLVNRQLAFIKPSTVIVYDHVITDNTQVRDLQHYNNVILTEDSTYSRWVKVIQHVQEEPQVIDSALNSYHIESQDTSLVYQVISPENPTINIINEKNLWDSSNQYQAPDNQRKWHFELSNKVPKSETEFITTLNFASIDTSKVEDLILTPIKMTTENSYILEGNITGLAIEASQTKYIILFNKDPNTPIVNARIKRPKGFESSLVYCLGFTLTE